MLLHMMMYYITHLLKLEYTINMWTKIKDNWKVISIIIIGLIVFLWGKSCGNKVVEPTKDKIVTITNYRDTIFPKDTVYVPKEKPVPYPVYIDTNTYKPKPIDSLEMYRFFVYKDSTEDSNVKIYSKIVTQGKTLNSFKPSYKLKVPLIIKDSTVVKIDSLVYRPYKYEIHAGGIIGFNTAAITGDLSIDKCTYGIGYDFINKAPIISFKYRLYGWTPKKK